MRVLTLVQNLGPGGTERVAQNYSIGYHHHGHDVAVMTTEGGGVRERYLAEAAIPLFNGADDALGPEGALRAAIDWAPDLIHVHRRGSPDPSFARVWTRIQDHHPGCRIIETNVFGKPDPSPAAAAIDVHLQLTRWSFWKWRRWTQAIRPAPLGVVIPNNVDESAFYPVSADERRAFRAAHGLPHDAVVFGMLARPIEEKWPPILFDAIEAVARTSPGCYFVGAELTPAARARVQELPPDVRARFIELPFIAEDDALRVCYGSVDVLLHACSMGESFGLTFPEAALCGTPAITLSRPGRGNSQVEVVGHERGGLVANDLASLCAAMHRMIQDADLRDRLAAGGAAYAREHFTMSSVMPMVLKVAAYTVEAPSRDALRRMLASDDTLITSVSDADVAALMRNTMGTVPLSQRLLMRGIHQPHLYALWSRLAPYLNKAPRTP